jgi:hypothetical protein
LKITGRRKASIINRKVYRILRKLVEKPKVEGKKWEKKNKRKVYRLKK